MTAKSVLNSSACVSIMLRNVPVVVTGIHMGNVGITDPYIDSTWAVVPGCNGEILQLTLNEDVDGPRGTVVSSAVPKRGA